MLQEVTDEAAKEAESVKKEEKVSEEPIKVYIIVIVICSRLQPLSVNSISDCCSRGHTKGNCDGLC